MLTGRPSTAERTTPAARSVSEARAWASADSAYSRVGAGALARRIRGARQRLFGQLDGGGAALFEPSSVHSRSMA